MPELPYQLIPVSLFLSGATMSYLEWRFRRETDLAEAVVIELREAVAADGDLGYKTVFRFDAGGRSWDVIDRAIRVPAIHEIGQRVAVRYPKLDPTRAELHHWWTILGWFAVGTIGLVWSLLELARVLLR